ncbi:MAG: DNA sulfur modification protein DndB [Rhodobacteraceae bacterium]|nr:DNA sulfur modification protein DndB [Paracoccaceae bacterium]
MKVTFPAMRGTIGGRTYYSCMMPLRVVPKMFTFRDWAEFSPEEREQRVLNQKRVPHIAKYILNNEEGYLFSAITASYQCKVTFEAAKDFQDLGSVEMNFDEAEFVINDGQHRCAAIAAALKTNPSLGDETISVLLFPYENRDRMQQMFSDLNRFVVKTSKSLDILYDKRDPHSRLTLDVIRMIDVFDGMVDRDAISIGVRSTKLFTLSTIYDANKELLRFHDVEGSSEDKEESLQEITALAARFWKVVSKHMPGWRDVKDKHMRAMELRQESLASHATVMRAIGGAGAELMQEDPHGWEERLQVLQHINWSKTNPEWEGICVVAGSVSSNRQSRQATKAFVKRSMGLNLTEAEARSLTPPEQQVLEAA